MVARDVVAFLSRNTMQSRFNLGSIPSTAREALLWIENYGGLTPSVRQSFLDNFFLTCFFFLRGLCGQAFVRLTNWPRFPHNFDIS